MLVQCFYQCGARERAEALRAERSVASGALLPAIALKLLLLDAQLAIGEGRTTPAAPRSPRPMPLSRRARAARRPAGGTCCARACT